MLFSKRMDMIKPSAIRSVQKRIAGKEGVISFAAGLPDPDLFPIEDLAVSTSQMIEKEGRTAFQYGLTRGYAPMIDIITSRMNKRGIGSISSDNVIITTGSQQGLALCAMMFLDKRDIVACENPTYLGGINACRPYEVEFAGVETDDEGMVPEQLDKLLRENKNVKMIYVIPNFQNPTGKAWTYDRRKAFMEIVRCYDVIVIEDDPYGELRFSGQDLPTLKSFDTQGKVIYLGSFSKILAPGLRLAWMCADEKVVKQAELIKEVWDLQSNQFTQLQISNYLNNNDIEQHIELIRESYGKKCDLMLQQMDMHFPEGTVYTRPEGGMFIWVELPNDMDADSFLDTALDAGIAFIPGKYFFANEASENTIRMNFTTVSENEIITGIEILGRLLKKELSVI